MNENRNEQLSRTRVDASERVYYSYNQHIKSKGESDENSDCSHENSDCSPCI